jgi:hypothetical protein
MWRLLIIFHLIKLLISVVPRSQYSDYAYGLYDWGIVVRFPAWTRDFFYSKKPRPALGPTPDAFITCTGCSFHGGYGGWSVTLNTHLCLVPRLRLCLCLVQGLLYLLKKVKKGNAIPVQAWTRYWGLQEVEATRISRQLAQEGGKVVSPTHPQEIRLPGTHFC